MTMASVGMAKNKSLHYRGKSGLVQGPDLYESVYREIIFNMDEKHLVA